MKTPTRLRPAAVALRSLFKFLLVLSLFGCSSAYKNEEYERSQRITVEFTNSHIGQRHIDAFAHFRFERDEVKKALNEVREFSKKSGQYKDWKDSIEDFSAWLDEIKEPGNYLFGQGLSARTSLVAMLLREGKGEVCPNRSGRCWKRSDIKSKKPKKEHIKRYQKWSAEPLKVKKYFMNAEDERIWIDLSLEDNAFGE